MNAARLVNERHLAFPAEGGSYILWMGLSVPSRLTIGKLGTFDFAPGWYGYVGSALGSGGLRGRLRHHLSPLRRPHWHIDYLRTAAPVRELWWRSDPTRLEHRWADALNSLPGATIPIIGFGASDCRCVAHLVAFAEPPSLGAFCERVTRTGVRAERDRGTEEAVCGISTCQSMIPTHQDCFREQSSAPSLHFHRLQRKAAVAQGGLGEGGPVFQQTFRNSEGR